MCRHSLGLGFARKVVCDQAIEAMRKCGKNLTRACTLEKLETVKGLDVFGLMSPISFGKGVRYSNQKVRIIRNDFANKSFAPVTRY